jgi:hypothetical protein
VTTPTKPLRSPLFSATQIAFIEEATQIEQQAAQKAGTVGYLARMLVQVTMPHAKQSSHEFTRTNGGFSVTMLAASQYGLPYGTVPRLLLAWMTTEVVRTKEATLTLGRSLSEFLRRLGYTPTGGKTGSIGRINRQMEALFRCMVSWNYRDKTRSAGQNILLVDEYELAWDPKQDNQEALWTSTVTLGKRFFDEISQRPVPIDMRALRALRGSSMRLDIYSWLTYRMSYLEQPTTIPWEALPECVNENETTSREKLCVRPAEVIVKYKREKVNDNTSKFSHTIFSSSGRLIYAASGNVRGSGFPCTKRSGCAWYAA